MTPGRICDLLMYWILAYDKEGVPEVRRMAKRAMLELPPAGYTGSLKGTEWDESSMLSGYSQVGA